MRQAAALLLFLLISASAAASAPLRVVSINLCTDQLVLMLLDRERVASVTWLSLDPARSVVADMARTLPVNHGLSEEILPFRPDMVIASIHTTRISISMLRRVGVPVVELAVPKTIDDVKAQLASVGRLLGVEEHGARLAATLGDAVAAIPSPEVRRPTVVVLQPNGLTVGAGSLVNELLQRAGFDNLAARRVLDGTGRLPLDVLILARPDLLILNAYGSWSPSLAQEGLRHPALIRAFGARRTLTTPPRDWICGGPPIANALARLSEARRSIIAGRP